MNNDEILIRFDAWIKDGGPAALVLRQELEPVEGRDGVFFPATYAPAEDRSQFAGGYNIDTFVDGSNVCLIDSVGSQANRLEPLFLKAEYQELVPKITVTAGAKKFSILEAGHRAGDALVRCAPELKSDLHVGFLKVLEGNHEPLAKIAPTSLVFGAWDSRDTEAKVPRLLASTIRAFNVNRLTRSANYLVQQQLDYTKEELIPIWESDKEKELYSKRGFLNALASASHGGVMLRADGKVIRDVVVSLSALRRLASIGSGAEERTPSLRRYILGLCLVALTAPVDSYLRQGCNLVGAVSNETTFQVVRGSDKREPLTLSHNDALIFAKAAATKFGVGPNRDATFARTEAESDIKGTKKLKGKVVSIDIINKKLVLTIDGQTAPSELAYADSTQFKKGRSKAKAEDVQVDALVTIELKSEVAVVVTIQR
jgi:CRISPR-associated protein Csb1